MDLTGKPFEASERKKNRKRFWTLRQKTVGRKDSESMSGHNKVSDEGMATTCRLKLKVPLLKNEKYKN